MSDGREADDDPGVVVADPPYDALMGQTTTWRGLDNAVWRNLIGPATRAVHTPAEKADFDAGLVADLHGTAAGYAERLVGDLTSGSGRAWCR